MGRVQSESLWLFCPDFADEFIGCQTLEGFEASGVVVGVHEVREVGFKLVVTVIVIALDGGFLDGPVHAFDLAIGPGMPDLGEAMFNAIFATPHIEHVGHVSSGWSIGIAWREGELDPVIGQNDVDLVGHGLDEGFQKGGCRNPAGFLLHLDKCEFARPVDGNGKIELALSGSHFGDIDVEIADGIALELFPGRLVAFNIGQP